LHPGQPKEEETKRPLTTNRHLGDWLRGRTRPLHQSPLSDWLMGEQNKKTAPPTITIWVIGWRAKKLIKLIKNKSLYANHNLSDERRGHKN